MIRKLRWLLLVGGLGLFSPCVHSQNGDSEKKLFTSVLQQLINPQASFLALTPLTPTGLIRVEDYTRNLGIDWSFELDGCDNRARMVAYGLAHDLDVRAGMILAIAPSSVSSQFIAHAPSISWRYHKAAFVKVDQNYYVIDYSLFKQIVPMEEWLIFLGITPSKAKSQIEFENQFSVSAATGQSWITDWQEWDAEKFRETQQFYPKFEHSTLPERPILVQELLPQIHNHEFRKVHISEVHSFWGEAYELTSEQRQNLINGSRCVESRTGDLSNCTSYLQLNRETCYFKFQVSEPSFQLLQIDTDLVCF